MECTTTGRPVAAAAVSPSVSPSSPSFPIPSASASVQDTSKPLRRKLQKTRNNLRIGKRGSHGSGPSSPQASPALECGEHSRVTATTHLRPKKSQVSCERRLDPSPHIPMPTDLSDSKWLEYIERSGLMSSPDLPLGLEPRAKINAGPTTSTSLLPDFANLTLSKRRSRSTSSRTSLDNLKSMSLLSPPSKPRKSISKRSLVAPGFKIGQLDGSQPRKKEIRVIKRKASVELIAEQYQAFLEARDEEEEDESGHEDEDEDQRETLKPQEPSTILLEPTRFDPSQITHSPYSDPSPHSRSGSRDSARETVLNAPGPAEPNNLSPGSDGTLVAFEEDAIYFKPVSFSDSPASSPAPERASFDRRSFDKPLPKPPSSSASDGSTPLQKTIAMLVKELSGAMPQPASKDNTQGLQISLMIESYQRLRDQVDTSSMDDAEARSVRLMFDGWLAALHTMHRTFTRSSFSRSSFSDRQAEDLAEPVD